VAGVAVDDQPYHMCAEIFAYLRHDRTRVSSLHLCTTVAKLVSPQSSACPPFNHPVRPQIYVSADATDFGNPVATGTWADDATTKTVTFAAKTGKAVRLTALTEAGGRGPWSSMAEVTLSGTVTTPPPAGGAPGKWGSVITFPIVPVAAALLPNGQVRSTLRCTAL
jgi:hypothetical protein